ncbi:uncharacterized protein [Eucyclogobius newberryi]|uniref:uncharacterized protein n=1 Tax=Eucyclogobius newberryi TaxID=166745 RepID=UPI003B5C0079
MERHCAWRLWVIEYAWAHNMIDVFQDVRALYWPDGDWGILSLDESWHVRVVSAQVYNIIKSRQTHHYEKVLAFLEHTHTLLPTLVPAIKHMKIVFGLKTMIIMWMLREGIGPISVVQKIIKYFPSKLPQYEEHCRKYEMFLMRRNQHDFRTFAQSLVMDKEKLEDYIQNHVEEQYGDHYAQKTEERLLHYLRELDKALPKCTYIDKIMKEKSPVKEWEKALLDLITDDSTTTATSLKTLLQSDATCFSLSKSHLGTRTATCLFPESHVGTSKEQLQPAAEKSLSLDAPVTAIIMVNNGKEPVLGFQTGHRNKTTCVSATETDSEYSSIEVSPHFCSKHQRWVRNILRECPGESSEQHLLQEISPSLFTPPSSSSSSDLTPSNLTTLPEHHLSPSPTSNQLQETEADPKIVEKHVSEPVELGPPLHPASLAAQSLIPGGRVLKVVIVPCSDVTPVAVYPFKSSSTLDNLQVCNNEDSTTASSILSNSAETSMKATITSSKPFISKLSRRFRLSQRLSQSQKHFHNKEEIGSKKVQSTPQMSFANTSSLSTHSTSRTDVSNNTQEYTHSHSRCIDHTASSHDRTTFNKKHLQPHVVLKRMSTEECLQVTEGRLQSRHCDVMEEHRDPVTFNVNFLYSDSSSEEETDSDTEYRPSRKTLRRWSRGLLPF